MNQILKRKITREVEVRDILNNHLIVIVSHVSSVYIFIIVEISEHFPHLTGYTEWNENRTIFSQDVCQYVWDGASI